MHIYFIGIGGSGIGPLALIAQKAGHKVSGSDITSSSYTDYLKNKGMNVSLDQSGVNIDHVHANEPIDLVVGVSAIVRNNPDHPEIVYAKRNNIEVRERDSLLNLIIKEKNLKLIAVAGTHGKTTTTAMIIWLMKNLNMPVSYSVGAKLTFGDMSNLDDKSEYFIYECDEFHKNFLNFYPYVASITGIAWDHHEIYATKKDYNDAFVEFLNQSKSVIIYKDDSDEIEWRNNNFTTLLDKSDPAMSQISLAGRFFREDAWLAVRTIQYLTGENTEKLISIINSYPGASRRMEKIADNIYSDYAHTPEKIIGCINTANEMKKPYQKMVIVYEPLTNRRQHFIKDVYKNLFLGVDKLYWVPSFKAREDAAQKIIEPQEFVDGMDNKHIAEAAELNDDLWQKIVQHADNDDFVVVISGGGGGSLDEWARKKLEP